MRLQFEPMPSPRGTIKESLYILRLRHGALAYGDGTYDQVPASDLKEIAARLRDASKEQLVELAQLLAGGSAEDEFRPPPLEDRPRRESSARTPTFLYCRANTRYSYTLKDQA